jgi:putative tricarboxylic transport membrane protein
MEIFIIFTLGILTGIAIGLFPVFPIYLGAFLLYVTANFLTPEQILLFWAVSSIGSQFFCSVSTITLGIPGDASSLIYINDIKKLSLNERNRLLWSTSRGSLISASFALCLVFILYYIYTKYNHVFLSGIEIKLFFLYLVIIFLIFSSPNNKLLTGIIGCLALFIAPQNNYALPISWYSISLLFQHTTFFMLVLALIVIPDILSYKLSDIDTNKSSFNPVPDILPKKLVAKNSLLGCIISLLPGSAAELSAAVAYHTTKGNFKNKIIAAETANNPGVIMMLLPFFLLGLPFTPSSIIVSNIMDLQLVNIVTFGKSNSVIFDGLTVFESLIALSLLSVLFYYFLSIRFINFYINIVRLAQYKLKFILLLTILLMMVLDLYIQEITLLNYTVLLIFYISLGFIFRRFKINVLPFVFMWLLGDSIIWSSIQFYTIYFGN